MENLQVGTFLALEAGFFARAQGAKASVNFRIITPEMGDSLGNIPALRIYMEAHVCI